MSEPISKRTTKEEKFLHRILDQLDNEEDGQMEEKDKRIEKMVSKARSKMGVGREQPSIMSKLKRVPKGAADSQECTVRPVNSLTGQAVWKTD